MRSRSCRTSCRRTGSGWRVRPGCRARSYALSSADACVAPSRDDDAPPIDYRPGAHARPGGPAMLRACVGRRDARGAARRHARDEL